MNDRRVRQPGAEPLFSPARAVARLIACLPLTLCLMPLQMVALTIGGRTAHAIPRLYHNILCRIVGLNVRVDGTISNRRPTLFVANHISYADIPAFLAVVDASFVAKAEIAEWPFFGFLAKLNRTVFVRRRSRHAGEQRDEIRQRLEAGDNIILFPEGTSHDGQRILPFKSALFSVAEGVGNGGLTVQPVSVAYTRLDGIPLRRALRPQYAWYGDMELLPHLFELMGSGTAQIHLIFHDPVSIDRFPSRKALAEFCQRTIGAGVDAANSGRPLPAPPAPPIAASPANP